MVARLECAPRAGPGERRRTNRWTGARIASFSTNFVRSHLLGVAAPGQLNRWTAYGFAGDSPNCGGFTGLNARSIIDQNAFGNLLIEDAAGEIWRIRPEELSCIRVACSSHKLQEPRASSAF